MSTEELQMVEGAAPAEIQRGPDEAADGRRIEVTGTRLLVQAEVLDPWVETHGGILVATDDAENKLEEAVVVGVGQGRYNAETGEYLGTNYAVGDRVWLRHGAKEGGFTDQVPGRPGLFIIQEDLVRARLHDDR